MFHWLKSLLGRHRTVSPTPSPAPPATPLPAQQPEPAAQTQPQTLSILLASVLKEEGYAVTEHGEALSLASGVVLHTDFLETHELGNGNIRTTTRVAAIHPEYFPNGLQEYQHSSGESKDTSLINGFRSWVQTDLSTIEDALAETTESCLVLTMDLDASEPCGALRRQIYMGPYIHYGSDAARDQEAKEEEHAFCPCCLYTKSYEAFTTLLKSDRFVGIRLFASRDAQGQISADCRVDGEDFPLGAEHLRKYVETWPQNGLEFRKQYVVIRTASKPQAAA
ncbi:DUF6348 family protein [Chitinimonas naiadis]